MTFDTVLMVDWSGGADRGAAPKADAIWACVAGQQPQYFRNRTVFTQWVIPFLHQELAAGRRVLAGFDFPFGYPQGFGRAVTGSDDPFALWDWFARHIEDDPKGNNRFDIAGQLNAMFDGVGPFWANGLPRDIDHLPRKGLARTPNPFPERRQVEMAAKGSFTCWQMAGAGAVGSQVMMGLPVLQKLRDTFGGDIAVWPFEKTDAAITLVEIWPTLYAGPAPDGMIKDAHQVQASAAHFADMPAGQLADLMDVTAPHEGWILGLNQPTRAAVPPPLRDDCFAMPQGAHWTDVDTALAHMQAHLSCVTTTKKISVTKAAGRILARDMRAKRAHPPTPNAAVDGYGFAGPMAAGTHAMPLVDGRSAAGDPYDGAVPAGHAIRILTGAALPRGVDTVILQEDVTVADGHVHFHGPLRAGANARAAGEDMIADQVIMTAGRDITAADIATMTAAGIGKVHVRRKLRVGILSTGDELAQAGAPARADQIYDANRPMLRAMVKAWGHRAIDLGVAPDDRDALRLILDSVAKRCDVMITSGGASAGDEDHMSALLANSGSFALWRIAMKPGRPLAMGVWNNVPVIGLPGNPVAAMVCAVVFAHPALSRLAGAKWTTAQGFEIPAGFTKTKKAGRREYIRARIENGQAVAFASEGSGRVSGLSWAQGLVVLGDAAQTVSVGDDVTFIPYASFGL